jgi:hypothetical protein
MSHDLMTMEIEVDPVGRRAAFGAAKQLTVKFPGLGQIIDRESEVETWHARHDSRVALFSLPENPNLGVSLFVGEP